MQIIRDVSLLRGALAEVRGLMVDIRDAWKTVPALIPAERSAA